MSGRSTNATASTPGGQRADVGRLLALVTLVVGIVLLSGVTVAVVTGIQRYRSWTHIDGQILEYETVPTSEGHEQRIVHFRRYAYRMGSRVVLAQGPDLRQGFGPEVSNPPAGTHVHLAYDPSHPTHATTLRDAFTPPGMSTRLLFGLVLAIVGVFMLRVFPAQPKQSV